MRPGFLQRAHHQFPELYRPVESENGLAGYTMKAHPVFPDIVHVTFFLINQAFNTLQCIIGVRLAQQFRKVRFRRSEKDGFIDGITGEPPRSCGNGPQAKRTVNHNRFGISYRRQTIWLTTIYGVPDLYAGHGMF